MRNKLAVVILVVGLVAGGICSYGYASMPRAQAVLAAQQAVAAAEASKIVATEALADARAKLAAARLNGSDPASIGLALRAIAAADSLVQKTNAAVEQTIQAATICATTDNDATREASLAAAQANASVARASAYVVSATASLVEAVGKNDAAAIASARTLMGSSAARVETVVGLAVTIANQLTIVSTSANPSAVTAALAGIQANVAAVSVNLYVVSQTTAAVELALVGNSQGASEALARVTASEQSLAMVTTLAQVTSNQVTQVVAAGNTAETAIIVAQMTVNATDATSSATQTTGGDTGLGYTPITDGLGTPPAEVDQSASPT